MSGRKVRYIRKVSITDVQVPKRWNGLVLLKRKVGIAIMSGREWRSIYVYIREPLRENKSVLHERKTGIADMRGKVHNITIIEDRNGMEDVETVTDMPRKRICPISANHLHCSWYFLLFYLILFHYKRGEGKRKKLISESRETFQRYGKFKDEDDKKV